MTFQAVILDWRGTLVTTLTDEAWVRAAFALLNRAVGAAEVGEIVSAIHAANGPGDRLDGPGVDADASLHRWTYLEVFADAGLSKALGEALYAVESDPRYNLFSTDAACTLRELHEHGIRIAVRSDIHFDLRPAFADAGMAELVDVFTLSFEQGLQKPDPRMFARTLTALGISAEAALMVGDRSGPDGAAVEHGITTLLLPPLRSVEDRRLHRVMQLGMGETTGSPGGYRPGGALP